MINDPLMKKRGGKTRGIIFSKSLKLNRPEKLFQSVECLQQRVLFLLILVAENKILS